jgi:hypothetical protein
LRFDKEKAAKVAAMRVITWVVFVVQARIYFQAIQGLCSGPVLFPGEPGTPAPLFGAVAVCESCRRADHSSRCEQQNHKAHDVSSVKQKRLARLTCDQASMFVY